MEILLSTSEETVRQWAGKIGVIVLSSFFAKG